MKALCVLPLDESQKKLLKESVAGMEFIFKDMKENPGGVIEEIEVCVGNASSDYLKNAKRLKLLQLNTAGAGVYVKPGVLPAGVVLCNASGAYGGVVSEFMLAGLFALFKNLHLYRDKQRQAVWKGIGEMKMVSGSEVLIIGLGDIGGEFAKRVKNLGAHVVAVLPFAAPVPDYVDELHHTDELDELLKRADVVALTLPGTAQTRHTIDRKRLASMKNTAFLLNTSRGNIVDTDALLEALQSGQIMGAFIDVTDPEPLPPEHPLWQQENVILTPHVAGAYSDWFYRMPLITENVLKLAIGNLNAYLKGEPLKNVVDFATGHRSDL